MAPLLFNDLLAHSEFNVLQYQPCQDISNWDEEADIKKKVFDEGTKKV